jgi:hypothetical protein
VDKHAGQTSALDLPCGAGQLIHFKYDYFVLFQLGRSRVGAGEQKAIYPQINADYRRLFELPCFRRSGAVVLCFNLR